MSTRPGALIVDSSSLDLFRSASARARFEVNCRVGGWLTYPSALNVFEAYKAKGNLRERLLETLNWLRGDRGLLPVPDEILKEVGRAIVSGDPEATLAWSGYEGALTPGNLPSGMPDKLTAEVTKMLAVWEDRFHSAHETARKALSAHRRNLPESEWRREAGDFLQNVWMAPEHAGEYVEKLWRDLQLPVDPPTAALLENETWRLYVEVWGIAAFRRAYLRAQASEVGYLDLMQVVYLSANARSYLLVYETALREAANQVLQGRYPMRGAVSPESFLD